jgi:aminoglycoside phosphotransferase
MLCHKCGWDEVAQTTSSYTSRVKAHQTKRNTALWSIGTKWILRDEPNDGTLSNEIEALEYLHSKAAEVPTPRIIRLGDSTDTFQFSLTARVQGQPLYDVYRTYTAAQRGALARQLGGYIRHWREITASRAQRINGGRLDDVLFGVCRGKAPECKQIGYTRDEWLESLTPELRKGLTVQDQTLADDPDRLEQRLRQLTDSFPECDAFVFTHGDLSLSNTIVKDGVITGIVGWERAGFYLWWAERMLAHDDQHDGFEELFDYAGGDFYRGFDALAFEEKVSGPVCAAAAAFELCPRLHRGRENVWLRQPFCKCKPVVGCIRQEDLGEPPTHEVADADPPFEDEFREEDFAQLDLVGEEEIF